jgi:hypothetical protein
LRLERNTLKKWRPYSPGRRHEGLRLDLTASGRICRQDDVPRAGRGAGRIPAPPDVLGTRRTRGGLATGGARHDRRPFAHLEAIARTLAGISPFLELGEDAVACDLRTLAVKSLRNCFDPASPDYLDFSPGGQIIVDACLSLRTKAPSHSNWLLFAAITEAFLRLAGVAPDPMRIDYALFQHDQGYVGGGWYKDGPAFHHDYYNAFVIQPMLLDTAEASRGGLPIVSDFVERMPPEWRQRAARFAEIQERQVAPDGTFPVTGRSIVYRCGAFQHLAQMALRRALPASVSPSQARVALTAVIRRTLEAPGTFDERGFLRIGLSGHQPNLGEHYISTGSLYLCTAAFLPLGLSSTDPFWASPDAPTTWQRAWSGVDLPGDHD